MASVVKPLSSLPPDWDEKLAAFPGATVFHTSAWARVLTETYGYQPLYLVTGDPAAPTGILPLMEVDSWLTGRRGLALPFTDACTILAHDAETAASLWNEAIDLGRSRKWRWLELRDSPGWLNQAPASTSFYHHVLDLNVAGVPAVSSVAAVAGVADPGYSNLLFSRFDSANRRAIRKAQQANLTVEITRSAEAMREFFRLMQLTRRRHGLPPQPWRFFESIHRHLIAAGNGCIVLVRNAGSAIAGAVYLHHGTKALYKFGASDERQQHLRGNNLVMWEAIRWHMEHGFTSLDFGRTSLHNDGLRRFKLSWGTTEKMVRYHRYSFRTVDYVTSSDRSSGLHAHLFRHLPRPIARLAGELLYKHIA